MEIVKINELTKKCIKVFKKLFYIHALLSLLPRIFLDKQVT